MAQVLDVLEPIWRTKTETASRVRGRIERILSWADKRAERERLNPARWRGHLDTQLPAPTKVRKPKHHAALPVSQVGSFLSSLRGQEGTAARALEFVILTAARSGEVRFATWPEIDFKSRTWTVPAKRMKSGRENRVPLSAAAISLLESIPLVDGSEVIFQAPRGGALSHMTLVARPHPMGRAPFLSAQPDGPVRFCASPGRKRARTGRCHPATDPRHRHPPRTAGDGQGHRRRPRHGGDRRAPPLYQQGRPVAIRGRSWRHSRGQGCAPRPGREWRHGGTFIDETSPRR